MFKKFGLGLILLFICSGAFALSIQSDLIGPDGQINILYSCKGSNVAPLVHIKDIPTGTKSLVLTLDDPDAPSGLWTHWLLWNLPPTVTQLTTNMGVAGINSWGNAFYQGPCPPTGLHHYYLKLYALDTMLNLPAGSNPIALQQSMAGHIVAEVQLMGVMAGK